VRRESKGSVSEREVWSLDWVDAMICDLFGGYRLIFVLVDK
jgi:hypothetical protein